MFHLDLKTLILMALSITLITGLLLVYQNKIAPHIKGPVFWSFGCFFISAGLFIFWAYPITSDYMAFVIAGTLTLIGLSLYLGGIWRFKQVKVNYYLIVSIPLLELIQGTLFYKFIPLPAIRMTLYSLFNIAISIFIIREFLKPVHKSLLLIARIGAFVFGVFGITMLFRAISSYFFTPDSAIQSTNINLILFYTSSLIQLLMSFVFIIMVNIRLSEDLREQIRTRNKFFSIISHDLNGPVGTISETLKTMNQMENMDKVEQKIYLEELEKLSESTYYLLQNLLKWSKNQLDNYAIQRESINLNLLVKENIVLLQQLARSKSIEVKNNVLSEENCFGDKRMIDTAIRNIISNSLKFTKPNGMVSIDCYKKNKEVFIEIKDTGIGMSEDKLKKLFKIEDSITTRGTEGEKGSGLGLFISKEFIEKNNGKLIINSIMNKGTEVTICLPSD